MHNIAIVCGGDSGEYEISIGSGKQVEAHLDRGRFVPWLIVIRGDRWIHAHDGVDYAVDKNDFSLNIGGKHILFDAVFNAIHGTPGENGRLQGYFDMLGIPYTSCDVTTSALTFNKSFCKAVVAGNGVRMAKSVHLFREDHPSADGVLAKLSLPCFVKPNNGGSSVGMSKVNRPEEMEESLAKAFREDNEILVEEFIAGRELTCGVLRTKGEIIALPVTEVISENEFFDYEAKYTSGMAREVVPADIPDEVAATCRDLSRMLYKNLNCKGVVRFDYIYGGGEFHFLEVNTVPGLSPASIVPKMAAAYGWTVTELFSRLLDEILP